LSTGTQAEGVNHPLQVEIDRFSFYIGETGQADHAPPVFADYCIIAANSRGKGPGCFGEEW
jgi:hypothetical protein